jgi:hypothetical protein
MLYQVQSLQFGGGVDAKLLQFVAARFNVDQFGDSVHVQLSQFVV